MNVWNWIKSQPWVWTGGLMVINSSELSQSFYVSKGTELLLKKRESVAASSLSWHEKFCHLDTVTKIITFLIYPHVNGYNSFYQGKRWKGKECVRTTVLICHLITDLPCLHKGCEMPPAIVFRLISTQFFPLSSSVLPLRGSPYATQKEDKGDAKCVKYLVVIVNVQQHFTFLKANWT